MRGTWPVVLCLSTILAGCGGGGSGDALPPSASASSPSTPAASNNGATPQAAPAPPAAQPTPSSTATKSPSSDNGTTPSEPPSSPTTAQATAPTPDIAVVTPPPTTSPEQPSSPSTTPSTATTSNPPLTPPVTSSDSIAPITTNSADEAHVPVPPPVVAAIVATPKPASVNRQLTDQPDDLAGAQVHVIYAVPSDGTDHALDLTDKFTNSLESVDAWLFAQTGNHDRLKLDRYQGKLDITFVRLPKTEAEYEANGWGKINQVEADLRALKAEVSGKIYLVYYDGPNPRTCADAISLQNGHQTAVMYLHGFADSPGITPCDANPVAQTTHDQPTYLDYVALHELIHVMGGAHVTDSPYDLMYGGATRWDQPTKIVLDFNQDSYAFDRSKGNYALGQFNLYDSPFVTKE